MFGLFYIEAGREPVQVIGYDERPLVYDNGDHASRVAVAISSGDYPTSRGYQHIKCQPRRLATDAWKTRELGRFADGTYVPLPWADLPKLTITADHFAHVSTVDGAKIAYTPDAAKGAGDIQTRVKPGKYLQQFYGDLFDAPTIAAMSAAFSKQYGENNVLLFADTEEAIENVYVNGPHSCMQYEASHFDSSVHPCTIYAAGDLAIAYMVRDKRITARALVWPSKKIYGRVYGDEGRLIDLLEAAEYQHKPNDLKGARMLRIEEGGGFVCPYIDHFQSAGDDGDYLILGESGVAGDNQNGLSHRGISCFNCEGCIDEDDAYSDDDGYQYCECCYSERFSYCEHDQETCDRDSMEEVIVRIGSNGRRRTQSWGSNAIENHSFICEGNSERYADDMQVELADGTIWSTEYYEEHGSICEGNSEAYDNDDMVTLEDGTHWSKDWFSDNGIEVDGKYYAKGSDEAIEATIDASIRDQGEGA